MTSTLTVEDAKRIMLDSVKDKYPTVVHAQFDGNNLTLMFDKPVTEDLMAKYAWVKYRKRTAP